MKLTFNYILREEFEKVKGNFEEFMRNEMLCFGTTLVNAIMLEERKLYQCCDRYERSKERKTISSGFHNKTLFFKFGKVTARVPETRDSKFYPQTMEKYSHHGIDLERMIKSLVVQGLSEKKASKVLNEHLSINFSKPNISNIVTSFDNEVEKYHKRKLRDDYIYLYCDAVYETSKGFKKHNKRGILAIYGIREDDTKKKDGEEKTYIKELIDYTIVDREKESTWVNFLNKSYKRGLKGNNLKLIIHDKNKGLINAINMVYPWVTTQHCIYHKMQNSIKKLEKTKHKKEFSKDLSNLYENTDSKEEFYKKLTTFRQKWIEDEQDAVKNLLKDIHKTLRYFNVDIDHRKFVTTNNKIERFFREIRRRTKLIDGFENDKSINRFFYHICYENNFIEQNIKEKKDENK
ncbi:transposase [bacterium]|nr:transposase [bacterium]